MKVIMNTPELKVRNLEGIGFCRGAAYLEVMESHNGEYVASGWRRKPLVENAERVLIAFTQTDYKRALRA